MRFGEAAGPSWIWKAVATAVVVVGLLYLVGMLLGGMLGPLRVLGQTVACQANVHNIVRGTRIYSEDYDDRFPPAAQWMDRMQPYVDSERRLHCPAAEDTARTRYGFAMNEAVGARAKGKIDHPADVPLIYDSSNLVRSAFDKVASLPNPGRHLSRARKGSPSRRGNIVGYADGSGRFTPEPAAR